MALKVIEYHECYHDTPYFREKLLAYEKEVENISESIQGLVKEVRKVINASKEYARAQLRFADALGAFKLETVGDRSEMEERILSSFMMFAEHIRSIEEERERLTDSIAIRVCNGLEGFLNEHISPLKDGKRSFEKKTEQFYSAMDEQFRQGKFVNDWDNTKDAFQTQAFQYLESLQALQERKVFDCMEPILGMMQDSMNFYHQSHEVSQKIAPLFADLEHSLQLTRNVYDTTMEHLHKVSRRGGDFDAVMRGHFNVSELNKGAPGTWGRRYLEYHPENMELQIHSFNPVSFKGLLSEKDVLKLTIKVKPCNSCNTIKLWCLEIISSDQRTFLLQTDYTINYNKWRETLDGKVFYIFSDPSSFPREVAVSSEMVELAKRCICAIEEKGLGEEGIYRKPGIQGRISRILNELEKGEVDSIDLSDCDVHTLSACVKRMLIQSPPAPLFSYDKHEDIVSAGKISNYDGRSHKIQDIIRQLPLSNQHLLKLLVSHLSWVSQRSNKNMMSASNLGVVFGHVIMRPRYHTVQSVMNIKYQNLVVQHMLEDYQRILYGTVTNRQKVRALYDCEGGSERELSFENDDVFENVWKSDEPQWLYADLNGKRGLIPENYIEYIV